MLEFEVSQIYLKDEDRYYLPLPKLNPAQIGALRTEFEAGGYSVTGADVFYARKRKEWLAISSFGLAWSPMDLLDAVVPPIVRRLDTPRMRVVASNPYFVTKKFSKGYELHFFPRLEALARWTSLRRQGECGLTPDEALVLKALLGDLPEKVECVTDYPTDGCTPTQVGRHSYYRSNLGASEFVANLRTTAATATSSRSATHRNSYLTRVSIIRTRRPPRPLAESTANELGQWCYLDFLPKTSNAGD